MSMSENLLDMITFKDNCVIFKGKELSGGGGKHIMMYEESKGQDVVVRMYYRFITGIAVCDEDLFITSMGEVYSIYFGDPNKSQEILEKIFDKIIE